MESASVKTIRQTLKQMPPRQVLDLLLRLTRFKKENKELLTYLLFEADDEAGYVRQLKEEITEQLEKIDGLPAYQYKKQFRKIQRRVSKLVRFMGSKTAAAELYLHMIQMISEKKKIIFTGAFLDKTRQQYVGKVEKLLPGIEDDLASDISRQLSVLEDE